MVRSVLTCGSEHQSWFPGCQKGRFSGHGGTTLAPRGTFNRKEIDLTVVVGNLGLPLWRRTQVIQPVPFGSALEGLCGGREETGKVSIDEPRDVRVGARARSR